MSEGLKSEMALMLEAADATGAAPSVVMEALALARDRGAAKAAQDFFADLAAQTRAPHYGGPAREFTQSILLRAIERGLYTPEKP